MKEVDYLITVDAVLLFCVIILIIPFVFMVAFVLGMYSESNGVGEEQESKSKIRGFSMGTLEVFKMG